MKELEKILEEIEYERPDVNNFSTVNGKLLAIIWNDCIDVVEDIIKKYIEIEKESNDNDCNNIDCDSDDIKLHPDDIFDDDDVQFEENTGVVGWGKW